MRVRVSMHVCAYERESVSVCMRVFVCECVNESVRVHMDAYDEIEEVGGIKYRKAGRQASKQARKM